MRARVAGRGGPGEGRARSSLVIGLLIVCAVVPILPVTPVAAQTGPVAAGPDPVRVARLRYEGGGDWYANPSSLPNLLAAIRDRTGIPVAAREAVVTPLDPALRDHPWVYMTGHGEVRFSVRERAALREWLLDGGFLHADDNYGLDTSLRRELAEIFPDRALVAIPPDHPVFHQLHDLDAGLPKIHEHDGQAPQALGIFVDGRLAVFYSYESDLGDGWEDPEVHDVPADVREQALRMGVNLFLYALGGARER